MSTLNESRGLFVVPCDSESEAVISLPVQPISPPNEHNTGIPASPAPPPVFRVALDRKLVHYADDVCMYITVACIWQKKISKTFSFFIWLHNFFFSLLYFAPPHIPPRAYTPSIFVSLTASLAAPGS